VDGKTVTYDGEYFSLDGFRLRCDPPDPAPPIDTAGLGPKAVELAGRFADGWHAVNYTRTESLIASRTSDAASNWETGIAMISASPSP